MLTVSQILDKIMPYTKDEKHCGFKKAKKAKARAELIELIYGYYEGKEIDLPNEILNLLK